MTREVPRDDSGGTTIIPPTSAHHAADLHFPVHFTTARQVGPPPECSPRAYDLPARQRLRDGPLDFARELNPKIHICFSCFLLQFKKKKKTLVLETLLILFDFVECTDLYSVY